MKYWWSIYEFDILTLNFFDLFSFYFLPENTALVNLSNEYDSIFTDFSFFEREKRVEK